MKTKLLTAFLSVVTVATFAKLPLKGRPEREAFLRPYIKTGAIAAEIGVDSGSFSYHVLLSKSPKKLFLIDCWEYWPKQKMSYEEIELRNRNKELDYQFVKEAFAPFENVTVIKKTSDEAASLFPDNYFDYVYIDADHTFDAMSKDLKNYFPKVKLGGLIMGDDYGWTGIAPAVQEFVKYNPGKCQFIAEKHGQFVLRKIGS